MPRPKLGEDTRDRILDALDDLLAHYGYKKTAIEDVARAAGIGKGTVYLFFPSKEELVLSSIDRIFLRVLARLRGIAESEAAAPRRIEEMLIGRVLFRHEAAEKHARAIDEILAALRPAFLALRRRHRAAEAELLGAVLAAGERAGELTLPESPLGVAHSLILATDSLLPAALPVEELAERSRIAERAHRLAELLLVGLVGSSGREPAAARSAPRGEADAGRKKRRS
ncbi:MAG TPA: TetR/AcrR family transcriptional regulator [Polyangia bacterium]|jgi:AcrR family transcriptional regulator|nr:TetR/AcrR family transcriptional regulator [Polyangia bacterium]